MQINFENPKIKQSEKTVQVGYSTSTLKRYRNDLNMLSPYRIQSYNTNKRSEKLSKQLSITIHITKMTSQDLK